MNSIKWTHKTKWTLFLAAAMLLGWCSISGAAIEGITGTTFNLEAKADYIVTSDGDSFLMWGYTVAGNRMQYPGPTLIVNQGSTITINLTNQLAVDTSIVFPGQRVTASGGVQGLLTMDAPAAGGTVSYTFEASQAGTYLYRSGTQSDLQTEMGLVGALIVRPTGYDAVTNKIAYAHSDTTYDREYLLILTEMDPLIHRAVNFGQPYDMSQYFPTNWFINGRNFPDDMAENNVPWLPTQPYNFVPRMHPGEKVLVRSIGAGVDTHPFHYHGNDFDVIAMDGRVLASGDATVTGPDLAWKATTLKVLPGKTSDILWTWSAEELGWDIYGHDPAVGYPRSDIDPIATGNICDQYIEGDEATYFDPTTDEYCPDHGNIFPVVIPHQENLSFGQLYSGSPFLGGAGTGPRAPRS